MLTAPWHHSEVSCVTFDPRRPLHSRSVDRQDQTCAGPLRVAAMASALASFQGQMAPKRNVSQSPPVFSPEQRLRLWHSASVSHVCSFAARGSQEAQHCLWRDEKHKVSFNGILNLFEDFNFNFVCGSRYFFYCTSCFRSP